MGDIKTKVDTMEVVICPKCGSAAVDYADGIILNVTNSLCTCRQCEYTGPMTEFVSVPFAVPAGRSVEEVEQAYLSDITSFILKEGAMPLGRILIQYGFLDATSPQPKELSVYLKEASIALAQTFLEVRGNQIESMRKDHGTG